MSRFIYIFLFIFLSNFLISQETKGIESEFPVFPICKLVPAKNQKTCFDETLTEHIDKYLVFPENLKELGLQAVVNVFFEIDINGKVDKLVAKSSLVGVEFKDPNALQTANNIFENAATEIFLQLPVMKPGKVNGEISAFPFRIPVTYRLDSQNFDLNDVFTIDEVNWAPLFPKTNNITSDQSIEIFKNNISKHLDKYLKHPKVAKNNTKKVIVFVEIIVENDGSIYEITSYGPEIYRLQAEKAIKKIPALEPALKSDYPVAMTYSFPVIFNNK